MDFLSELRELLESELKHNAIDLQTAEKISDTITISNDDCLSFFLHFNFHVELSFSRNYTTQRKAKRRQFVVTCCGLLWVFILRWSKIGAFFRRA